MTNCWTLHARHGSVQMQMDSALVTTRDGGTRYHVEVQSGHFGHRVRVADPKLVKIMPGDLGWVFEAELSEADNDTLPDEASYELTPLGKEADHTLLLVKSDSHVQLNQGKSAPHFRERGTWIGADGPGLKLQAGRHQSPFKRQLFRLRPGESILFFDSAREVTKITAGKLGDEPRCERAKEGEVADYILGEAKKRGRDNPSARSWCHYALLELGCQHQIDQFYQLYPGFHRK